MTSGPLFFLYALIVSVSAFLFWLLMRRYGRKPALWVIPGIYCSLMMVYFGEDLFRRLLPFYMYPLEDYLLEEFLFWGAVFLVLLILSGRGSSKVLVGLAFVGGALLLLPSLLLLFALLRALEGFLGLQPMGMFFSFLAMGAATASFCLFLLVKFVCHRLHRPLRVSEWALFAAVNLGALAAWYGILSSFDGS